MRLIISILATAICMACSMPAFCQDTEPTPLQDLERRADTLQGYQKAKVMAQLAEAYETVSISKSMYYCRLSMEYFNNMSNTDDFLPENDIFKEPDSILDLRARIYFVLGKNYDRLNYDRETLPGHITEAQTANKQTALEYFQILLKIRKHQGKLLEIAQANNAVAMPSMMLGYTDKALEIFNANIEIYQKLNNKRELAKTYNNIAYITSLDTANIDKAISLYRVAMRYAQEDKLTDISVGISQYMADLYMIRKNYTMASLYYTGAIEYCEQTHNYVSLSKIFRQLSYINKQQGNHAAAYDYLMRHVELKDSLENSETILQINELSAKYNNNKKQEEISELVITKENQHNLIIIFVMVSVLALVALLVALRETKRKNKSNNLLSKANQNINNSLNYASRLQKIIIQGEKKAREILSDYFVFHRPRNIVSGDFYYVREYSKYTVVAVADCTGHGVPAAFLSVLNITFFNEVFQNSHEAPDPGQVLDKVRGQVIKALNQTDDLQSSTDGMDCGLVIFNKETLKAQYAGAYIDLLIMRKNGNLDEIRSTHNPVCWYFKQLPFRTINLQLDPDDVIYMFSDGYTDQVGGPNHEKFTKARLRQTLSDMHGMPLPRQKETLDITLNHWQRNYEQIDDILILGIKTRSLFPQAYISLPR
ncbi:MAG: SpoIIE family protein phosphatase [Bacteroidales bacterium]|nr:SpoIIE family protein phosphatase [Bacteroidales bacterium]